MASNKTIKSGKLKKVIFDERLRMTKVKLNYRNANTDMNCPRGCPVEEDSEHLTVCDKIEDSEPVDLEKIKNGLLAEMLTEATKLEATLNKAEEMKIKTETAKAKKVKIMKKAPIVWGLGTHSQVPQLGAWEPIGKCPRHIGRKGPGISRAGKRRKNNPLAKNELQPLKKENETNRSQACSPPRC